MRERSAKGDGGAIPVRLSAVRTSVVLLQSRICAFTRARISARRAVTDQHREPIQDVSFVTRVGLEWKRRSADTERCGRVFRPWWIISLYLQRKWCLNWSTALLLVWEIARPSEARDVRESFRPCTSYFAINVAIRAN